VDFFVVFTFVVVRFAAVDLAAAEVFLGEREEAAEAFASRPLFEFLADWEFFLGGFAIKFFIMQKLQAGAQSF
jgi:hypothetical protein